MEALLTGALQYGPACPGWQVWTKTVTETNTIMRSVP